MANTLRFIAQNFATQATASWLTPPLDSPLGPADNALNGERRIKWVAPGNGGADIACVLDLGAAKSNIRAIGVAGLVRGGGSPGGVVIQSAVTWPNPAATACATVSGGNTVTKAAGGFLAAGFKVGQTIIASVGGPSVGTLITGVTDTTITHAGSNGSTLASTATITATDQKSVGFPNFGASPDALLLLAAPITARFIFLTFTFCFNPFAVGKLVVGPMTDLGIAYSAGSSEAVVQSKARNTFADGSLVSTRLGPNRRRFNYQWNRIKAAERSTLLSFLSQTPVLIVTPGDEVFEVEATEDVSSTHVWGSPDLYDVAAAMESLP
jgi:hypothetical protein